MRALSTLYEAALDDSPRCAEVHYKLALLYDDKLNDPVSALHHFRRYLALSPTGAHAADVKNSIKHDEIAALTVLSGDSVITRSEAARLRNENLNLHKELEARAVPARSVTDKSQEGDTSSRKTASRKETEATSCNQAIRSSPFRESFINRPSAGKRSWTRTGRIFATPKTYGGPDPGYSVGAFGLSGRNRGIRTSPGGPLRPEVGHLVIENALVRLACRQHALTSAHRKIFVHTIVCGKRENFADVVAASFVILAHYERAHGIDEKGTGENRRSSRDRLHNRFAGLRSH